MTNMTNQAVSTLPKPGLVEMRDVPHPNQREMRQYRLLAGFHYEHDPEAPAIPGVADVTLRRYREGEIVNTPNDYDKWPTKFQRIDNIADNLNQHIWDASKETIDQFVNRMRGLPVAEQPLVANAGPPPAPPAARPKAAPTPTPTQESSDTYGAMTLEELKRWCKDMSINTAGCKSQEDYARAARNFDKSHG